MTSKFQRFCLSFSTSFPLDISFGGFAKRLTTALLTKNPLLGIVSS